MQSNPYLSCDFKGPPSYFTPFVRHTCWDSASITPLQPSPVNPLLSQSSKYKGGMRNDTYDRVNNDYNLHHQFRNHIHQMKGDKHILGEITSGRFISKKPVIVDKIKGVTNYKLFAQQHGLPVCTLLNLDENDEILVVKKPGQKGYHLVYSFDNFHLQNQCNNCLKLILNCRQYLRSEENHSTCSKYAKCKNNQRGILINMTDQYSGSEIKMGVILDDTTIPIVEEMLSMCSSNCMNLCCCEQ